MALPPFPTNQNQRYSVHAMRTTLLRYFLATSLSFVGFMAMAQTLQDPDCNVCNCPIVTSPAPSTQATPPINVTTCPGTLSYTWNANIVRRSMTCVVGREYLVNLCGATENTVIYVVSASTGITVTGACDDDGCGVAGGPSSLRFIAPTTGAYYLWAFNGNSPCTNLTAHAAWTVTVTCLGTPGVPANDNPCGAPVLTLSTTSCTDLVSGTTFGATATTVDNLGTGGSSTFPPTGCGAVGYAGADVWYQLVVPASGYIGIEVEESGMCAAAFGLYTSPDCSAGPFTWIGGSPLCVLDGLTGPQQNPGFVFNPAQYGLTTGQTVYVRIWERTGAAENGSFSICAYNAPTPPGDEPCIAIPITPGDPCVPVEYSTANMQPKPAGLTIGNMSCGMPGAPYATPALWNPVVRDMWFSVVVPPLTNNMTVTLFSGSLDDMAMAWYRASGNICGPAYGGSLTQIAGVGGCNQTIGAGNNMARINSSTAGSGLTGGETIYIRVWNQKPGQYFYSGTFSICVTPNNPPPNDNPCGAIALEAGAGECILFPTTNENATNTGLSFAPGASSAPAPCGAPPANYNDVWYTLEVPVAISASNPLIIDTDDVLPLNFAMAVYRDVSGTGCPTLLTLATVGACATAGSTQGNANMPRLSLTPPTITPGETLYIRIWAETNNQQGNFSICAYAQNPPACQGIFYDSGGATSAYANFETQTRTHIPEKVGDVVTLTFSQFNIESGWDFLRIYNGTAIAANLIGTFTGTNIPSQISSTVTAGNPDGRLTVVFTADDIITGPGYAYKVSCGPPAIVVPGTCSVIANPGAIPNVTNSYDPGGPGGTTYPGNLGVQSVNVAPYHVIYCPSSAGEAVTIEFTSFDVEDNYDGLYIFDANVPVGSNLTLFTGSQFNSGNPAQLTFSGPYNPPVPPSGAFWGDGNPGTFTATNGTGCISLVFYTDAIVSGSGWEASVRCGPPPPPPPPTPCDALFYETPGGSSGNYANNVNSTQTFTSFPGRILTATFQQFNLEANWDKMYVFDGPTTGSPLFSSGNGVGFGPAPFGAGAYWGTGIPGPFTASTPGGALTFHFVSDASLVRPGWVARLSCPAQVANDEPCAVAPSVTGATLMTPGPSCLLTSATTVNSTTSSGVAAPSCGNYSGGDVWFRFTAPPSGRVFIDTHAGTLTDAAMALYSAATCGGPFTAIECDDDDGEGLMPAIDRMCNPLTPGATYWLRVWGYANRRGTFDICIVEGPGNTTNQTDCGGAFSLCTSSPFNGVAYGNGCGPDLTSAIQMGCLQGERQGSWYAFRTNAAGNLGMTITPSVPADIDWAIWQGTLTGSPNPVGISCLPAGAPVRCSFASRANTMSAGGANPTAATGMGRPTFTGIASYLAPASTQNDAVDGWVPGITVAANQMYLLFVDDHHLDGVSYSVVWSESTPVMGCEILPVEALQLEAAPQLRTVDLIWTTTTEQNTSHFIIERSTDGLHFTPIGRSDAAGYTNGTTVYQSVDDAPELGLNYYRLQQVDNDGSVALSNIVTALFEPKNVTVMVVPNPTRDQAELLLSAAHEGDLAVRITDGSGRMVASFLAPSGMQRIELPIGKLEAGSYTVQLVTDKGEPHARTRFVKQ